jgi:uncharacterized protein
VNEANKSVARQFLQALGAGDIVSLKNLVTADIEVITPGIGDVCGTRNYEVLMAVAVALPQITKAGIEFKVINLTAEDDRVACEAEGYSTMINGKDYNNTYHFLFFIRDGKVCKVKEYLCTKLADSVLGPYVSGAAA